MKKSHSKKAPNRLLEILKQKQEVQAARNKVGNMGKDLSSQFSSQSNRVQRPTKPGGRNGQGKP